MRVAAALAWLLAAAAPAAADTGADPAELARTWDAARIFAPEAGAARALRAAELPGWLEGRAAPPVVLYAHGCDGPGRIADETGRFLARAGYLVVAPDGFARETKPRSCDPALPRGGLHRAVLGWRHAELRHALARLEALVPGPPALMGHSEGAIAAATFAGPPLAARILEGWTCHAGWPEYRGVAAPAAEPVLALVGRDDPWFRAPALRGDCGAFLQDDDLSVTFEPPGHLHRRHWLSSDAGVRALILDFLAARRPPGR